MESEFKSRKELALLGKMRTTQMVEVGYGFVFGFEG